jgi:hypothetical protein
VGLDIGAPARGCIEVLNVGGTWGADNMRVGGTWPGTIMGGSAYQPTQPFEGTTPALFCSSVPLIANIVFEGAVCHRLDGTLELYYVDRLSIEQGLPVAVIDKIMTDNCTGVINALLANHTLNGTVVSITAPLEVVRDPEGIFREWAGAPFVWCSIRVPFISRPSIP